MYNNTHLPIDSQAISIVVTRSLQTGWNITFVMSYPLSILLVSIINLSEIVEIVEHTLEV
jgi:hypothetical protein